MASDTAKMFGCPVCGFRVSQGEIACPRCGNEFDTSTKFECPFCGELVESGAKTCPSCHVNYSDFREKTEARGGDDSIDNLLLEIIKLESQAVSEEGKKLSCPICSWLLDGTESECPKCGKSFAEDITFQCPVCGSLVNAKAVRCSECGSAFEEDKAAARTGAHEAAASALDEIMSAVSSIPEETKPARIETEPEIEDRRSGAVKSKVSAIFGRPAPERAEPERREAVPPVKRRPEPVPEPEPVPPKMERASAESEAGPEPAEEEPKKAQPAQPKKSRQRKLKTKPK